MKSIILITAIILFLWTCQTNQSQKQSPDQVEYIQSSQERVTPKTESKEKIFSENMSYRKINELEGFEHYKGNSGSMIGSSHSVGLLHHDTDSALILLSFNETHQDSNGKAVYRLLDTLMIRHLNPNYYITINTCLENEQWDNQIVAMYEHVDDVEYYTEIKKAWRFNTELLKIEPISTVSIKCVNEGYGI